MSEREDEKTSRNTDRCGNHPKEQTQTARPDGKYAHWSEVVRDKQAGKLKVNQVHRKQDSDTELEDGEEEDSEFENYDTSERDG